MRSKWITLIIAGSATLSVLLAQTPTPKPAAAGDWPMFSHDLSITRFSTLTQINTKNVAKLVSAWT